MPSLTISSNQVINVSDPDAQYQIQTRSGIDDDARMHMMTDAIIDAIRQVEEVRPDRPVDPMYPEMGDSIMIRRNSTFQNGERFLHSQPLGISSAFATQGHPDIG